MGKSYLGQLAVGKGETNQGKGPILQVLEERKLTKTLPRKRHLVRSVKVFTHCGGVASFKKKTVKKRCETVKKHQLYFNCFGTHVARNCTSNGSCIKYNRRHHTLLHVPDEEYVAPRQRDACVNGAGAHSVKFEEVSRTEDKQKSI